MSTKIAGSRQLRGGLGTSFLDHFQSFSRRSQNGSELGQQPYIFRKVPPNFLNFFRGGVKNLFSIFRGVWSIMTFIRRVIYGYIQLAI